MVKVDGRGYNMKLYKTITLLFLLALINTTAFASNDFVSGMVRMDIGNFLIFSGRNSDRDRMVAANFNLLGYMSYNGEKLVNNNNGDNYHVFKTSFSISDDLEDKNLSFYISYFDTPVIIRINDIVIYRKGFKPETDGNLFHWRSSSRGRAPYQWPN
jgi:hypothetical protein